MCVVWLEPTISCSHWGLFYAPAPLLIVPDDFEFDWDSVDLRPGHITWVKDKH